MAVKQVAIRLKPEGGAEVTTAFRQAEEAGVKAATNTAAATEKATAAAERQAAQWRRNAEAIRAAGDAADAQARFNAQLGVTAPRNNAAESASVFIANDNDARRAAMIRAELDPLWGAQNRYNEALKETNRLRAAGHLTDDQAIKRQNQLQVELDQTTAAMARQNGLTGRQRQGRASAVQQLGDIGVTGAMGMNPAMIAIQQGPQLLTAMADAGIKLTPVMIGLGAAIGLTAAGVVALAAGWAQGSSDAAKYEQAATGIGRTAGLTGAQLNELVKTHAKVGEVSIASARDQAAAYLATGRIGEEVMGRLIDRHRDYAAFAGKDAKEATQALAEAMLDPAKAGEEMTRSFGLLTQAELNQIQASQKSGDQMRAQVLLLDALDRALEGHADKVDEATTAWQALGRWMSDTWTNLGEALYDTEEERLRKLIDIRARYEADMAGGTRLNRGQQRYYDEVGEEAWALQTRLNGQRNAEAEASATAQANQAAQLAEDRRKAAEAEARRQASAARRAAREAEQEAREQLRRDRRAQDRETELRSLEASAILDTDRVRDLQDEVALRTRIRALIDDGAEASVAKRDAEAEQVRILAARALTQRREQDEISRAAAVEADRILGNNRIIAQDEERLDLHRRINEYVKAGADYYDAWLRTILDMKEVEEARAEVTRRQIADAERAHSLTLARLRGNNDEVRRLDRDTRIDARAREIEQRGRGGRPLNYGDGVDQARREVDQELAAEREGAAREGVKAFAREIRRGEIRDALSGQFDNAVDRMINKMIDGLFEVDWAAIFNSGNQGGQNGQGGGGWTDWIGTAVNWVFGSAGKNANGTDYWGGGLTWLGERGPELVNLPRGSSVMNHERSMGRMRQAAMAPAQAVTNNHYYLDGAVTTDELWKRIDNGDRRAASAGASRGAETAVGVVQGSDATVRHGRRMLKG